MGATASNENLTTSNEIADKIFKPDSVMDIGGKLYYRPLNSNKLYKVFADDLDGDGEIKQRWKLVEPEEYANLISQTHTKTKMGWFAALESNEYPISLVPFKQSEEEIN